ncbi:hypothetical protein MJO28_011498 [Puccinia striiformis f. sp. tritici]|uniref:Uncharacterized protein n=1 Tax=Puccinia striiformis f. sp. tritici TaxID=168172 RepID=A0ACC0E2R3_9BASI|nr:hypothetical protein MJO28_011498 [Puccinia striiformis f. sp. tritici]
MTDARAASPPLATHPHRTPVYAGEARTVPHFLESRITLPKYNPKPFGRKPVKIKTQNVQGIMFNGTNMEIGDFISRVEKAAQGSDICLQIVFFMQGEALAKEVQEMMQQAVNGSHIFPPYRTIMEYIGRERKTMSTLDIDDWLKEPQKAPASAP